MAYDNGVDRRAAGSRTLARMETPVTDREIIKKLEARDESALTELAGRYGKQLKGIALGILGSDADAEECLNDAYLKVWNAIPPAAPDDLQAYVSAIVRNTAVNMYHAAHRQKDIPAERLVPLEDAETDGHAGTLPADNCAAEAELGALAEAMARYIKTLPERDQKVFVARYRYEASVAQIARKLGIPAGTVMSTLFRLRKGLAAFLKKEGIDI